MVNKRFAVLILMVALVQCIRSQGNDNTTTTTTTTLAPTTTTTQAPSTTTTAPEVDKIFNFTLPKNESEHVFLRLRFSLAFDITYTAEFNDTKSNATVKVKLDNVKNYDGTNNDAFNAITFTFDVNANEWEATLNYTLKNKNEYSLDSMILKYVADKTTFGNITKADEGKKFTSQGNALNEFAASKGNSFKCSAKTKFTLDEKVQVEFTNYQGQPFISPESKSKDFDTAIECPADTAGTSKLVPIIVGSSLAVLVVLVLIAYIVGRHKHRTGYQTV